MFSKQIKYIHVIKKVNKSRPVMCVCIYMLLSHTNFEEWCEGKCKSCCFIGCIDMLMSVLHRAILSDSESQSAL